MTTHCKVLWPTSRSCWTDGKATFTIAMSSTTMNCAAHARARITPGWIRDLVVSMAGWTATAAKTGRDRFRSPHQSLFDMAVVIVITGSAGMVLDGLGRLALTARRWGGEVCVRDADPALVELIEACGLAGVLPGECRRDAEQREQARVEEGVEPDDPAL